MARTDEVLTEEGKRGLVRLWWVLIVLGLLSLVVGGVVIARPSHSLRALAVITGIFILIDGVGELVLALADHVENRSTAALLGILNLIAGVMLIRHPIGGVEAVALFVGIWLIAVGVVRLMMGFERPEERLGRLIVATIEAIAGIVIVCSVNISYDTLSVLVGVSFIANGIGMIIFGLMMRTMRTGGPSLQLATS